MQARATDSADPQVSDSAPFRASGPVDVAVIVVTYQNAADIEPLLTSLRTEAAAQTMRVIVADNNSTDGTPDRVRAHADVILVETGGNLGYAGGINRAAAAIGEAESLLILNPDLRVRAGCVGHLRERMSRTGAGVVVPAIEGPDGRIALSLRREPRIANRLGDALFGSRWTSRPQLLSETVRDVESYRTAHQIEWATGAAALISRKAARQIGDWDERFFLYSEETDYFRRMREAGFECWYEPRARVVHREGGSGRSPHLVALTVVNAVRYIEKHHPHSAWLHRGILAVHELRRWRDPDHRIARSILLSRKRWDALPKGDRPASSSSVDHVIVTRFNLPSEGSERLIRAQEGWLRDRVALFERYTVPSVRAQTVTDFRWIVYLDPESPPWLLHRLQPLLDEGLFTPLFREAVTWQDLADDARNVTGAHRAILITTNLDNDDALATDFVERLQDAARPGRREALFLIHGVIRSEDRAYIRRDRMNAFCSVAEPWKGALTAWRDWHILVDKHMEVRNLGGPPGWLQVIHGRNVSNRVRGRLVSPDRYASQFAGLLDDLPSLHGGEILADRLLFNPYRETRELARITGKTILLRVLGKEGLSQLREWLGRARHR